MNRIKEIAVKENEMALPYAGDLLSEAIRLRVREAITEIVGEELNATLGARPHERTKSRRGYRHGSEDRTLTTSSGKTTFRMPRAKVFAADGKEQEW